MNSLGVGVIGMGWMGHTHSRAYRQLRDRFPELDTEVRLVCCADAVPERAREGAARHGFEGYTSDWSSLIENDRIEAVSVTTPNGSHEAIVSAAARAGKHILCEKPVGMTPRETVAIHRVVEQCGVLNLVGFNYRWAPMVQYARNLIREGHLGEITHFRSRYFEGYARSREEPLSWRFDQSVSGTGVLNDMLSHTTDLAHFLVGPIKRVVANRKTWIGSRPPACVEGSRLPRQPVTNEDYVGGLMQFENDARGSFEACRIITGPQQELKVELNGTTGSIVWDFERMNELQVYVNPGREPVRQGYTRLFSNPEYPFHGHFNPGQGTGLGYEDLKIIEASRFVKSILEGKQATPGVREATRVAAVHAAVERSWESHRWQEVGQVESEEWRVESGE